MAKNMKYHYQIYHIISDRFLIQFHFNLLDIEPTYWKGNFASVQTGYNLAMSNINQSPPKPRTISINLTKVDKKKTTSNSPKPSPDKFKMPLSKLRKTFEKSENVFEKINANNKKRLEDIHSDKKKKQAIQEELVRDMGMEQQERQLSESDLQLCKEMFKAMAGGGQFVQIRDLKMIRQEGVRDLLKVVFYRKEKNSVFEFIYNCWDTGAIDRIRNWCKE